MDILLGNFFSCDNALCNLSNGLTSGLVTGYYGDVLTNLFNGDPLLQVVSDYYQYQASILSGGLGSITGEYLDPISNTIVVTISFYLLAYWNNFNEETIKDIIFGTIAVAVIFFIFGTNSRSSFYNGTVANDTDADYLALLLINIFFAIDI